MKDYGNAGALCGAVGCMVLLIVSMHFAKAEDAPKTEKVSAEVLYDENKNEGESDNKKADGTGAATGENNESTTTQISMTSEEEFSGSADISSSDDLASQTTTAINSSVNALTFIGPLSKETREALAASVKYEPEIMHQAYPQQLSIVGDSIASGFGVYGILDNPYDFATGNIGARSISEYSFSYNGEMGTYLDVLKASQPAYIYLSMGMNDVNMTTSDEYAENYKGIITGVREACPDSIIIVASITPISAESTFTANSTITMFNEKLKSVVDEFASSTIIYYDAGSFVTDEYTGGLKNDCDGGDGIHLSSSAYNSLLENLYPILDEMPVPQSIIDIIEEQNLASQTTAAEDEYGTSDE